MKLDNSMRDILALTRAGKLGDAVKSIRRALSKSEFGQSQFYDPPLDSGPRDDPDFTTLKKARVVERDPIAPAAAPSPKSGSPKPGSFERHVFQGSEGKLTYHLYVPDNAADAAPLVVMLHGCSQSGIDFAAGTQMNEQADRHGFLVAYPDQPASANPQRCWNWFRPGDQARGSGEPALIAAMTRSIMASNPIDPARVYVAGLSAGGAAAAVMAATYPDIYAAVGVHSGLACGVAKDMPSAFAAMGGGAKLSPARAVQHLVPTITVHGTRDTTVNPANSELIHAANAAHPHITSLTRRTDEQRGSGGRDYRRTVLVDEQGRNWAESWEILGSGHAWSGGSSKGSYTDPAGPSASAAMAEFFLQHRLATS